ncbi:1-deoxy-D-xylulose-5-phosphate synthase [bacterium]|nr:1-deoxy-D-xylulose-5-phosphate synthase [bacterium]
MRRSEGERPETSEVPADYTESAKTGQANGETNGNANGHGAAHEATGNGTAAPVAGLLTADDYIYLDHIDDPADLRQLPKESLPVVCDEVRRHIVNTISQISGHFASNLGAVELTVAVHYAFNTPYDILCWDVGHQAYPHKVLCGRRDQLHTIRQLGGLSGFPHYDESPHDHFMLGHAGTSISSAIGLAEGVALAGEDRRVVAVIGDGSLTAGLAFEGLNHAGHSHRAPIVIVNDNEMSIDPNVGALSRFLSRKLTTKKNLALRQQLKNFLNDLGPMGEDLITLGKRMEEGIIGMHSPGHLFESLGFTYVGPVDGHDVLEMVKTLEDAKKFKGPVLVHALTVKGKGYSPAENDPLKYHAVSKFDPAQGMIKKTPAKPGPKTYTDVFADTLVELASNDTSIVAVTPAMLSGTGMIKMMKAFPDRTFDVGIAEQHAVTFAAGLAKMGFKAVAGIYSTFLQRGFDQVVHDVLLQKLPVIFAMDRGGLVGAAVPSHHGVFDIAYLRHLPRIKLMAPKDEAELRDMLYTAIYLDEPVGLRYPRGEGVGVEPREEMTKLPVGKAELLREGSDIVLIGYGNRVHPCLHAAEELEKGGVSAAVINARWAKPLDAEMILEWARKTGRVVTCEDGCAMGGFGSAVAELLMANDAGSARLRIVGLPDEFCVHGTQDQLFAKYGIDEAGIVRAAKSLLS